MRSGGGLALDYGRECGEKLMGSRNMEEVK